MMYSQFNPRPFEAHSMAVDLVPAGSRVLDLGCATGYISRELLKKSCTIIGVDNDREALKVAQKYCEKVFTADIERAQDLKLAAKSFDVVLCLDVIEHLKNREALLAWTKRLLKPNGILILSTPNIAHISIRWNILRGDFIYSSRGILDGTHVHFFTKKTLEEFLTVGGYTITKILPTADFGQLPFGGRVLRHIPKSIQFHLTLLLPTILGVQYIAVCQRR